MPKIFISYRRSDTLKEARLIAEKAIDEFGESSVFFDHHTLAVGDDFPAVIESDIESATDVLVIIGPNWLETDQETGTPRLHDANDWVRREIRLALSRGIPLVPVLVENAVMPERAELPADIAEVSDRNAFVLPAHATGFRTTLTRLMDRLRDRSSLLTAVTYFGMAAFAGIVWFLLTALFLVYGEVYKEEQSSGYTLEFLRGVNDAVYIGALVYAILIVARGYISLGRDKTLLAVSIAVALYFAAGGALQSIQTFAGIPSHHLIWRPLSEALQFSMFPICVLWTLRRRLRLPWRIIWQSGLVAFIAFAASEYFVGFVHFDPPQGGDVADMSSYAQGTVAYGAIHQGEDHENFGDLAVWLVRLPVLCLCALWASFAVFYPRLSIKGTVIQSVVIILAPIPLFFVVYGLLILAFFGLEEAAEMVGIMFQLRIFEATLLFFFAFGLAKWRLRRSGTGATQPA